MSRLLHVFGASHVTWIVSAGNTEVLPALTIHLQSFKAKCFLIRTTCLTIKRSLNFAHRVYLRSCVTMNNHIFVKQH
jgi:hypothetical protein